MNTKKMITLGLLYTTGIMGMHNICDAAVALLAWRSVSLISGTPTPMPMPTPTPLLTPTTLTQGAQTQSQALSSTLVVSPTPTPVNKMDKIDDSVANLMLLKMEKGIPVLTVKSAVEVYKEKGCSDLEAEERTDRLYHLLAAKNTFGYSLTKEIPDGSVAIAEIGNRPVIIKGGDLVFRFIGRWCVPALHVEIGFRGKLRAVQEGDAITVYDENGTILKEFDEEQFYSKKFLLAFRGIGKE